MESKSKRFVGYCPELPIKKGDVVTIPKGTAIESTSPKGGKVAGRTFKVRVTHVNTGSNPIARDDEPTNPVVEWAGSGGYWHRVDINDIPEAQEKEKS